MRDDLRQHVRAKLDDKRGILVVDETGLVKHGAHSVGVTRQSCRTVSILANCQVRVFLSYAGPAAM